MIIIYYNQLHQLIQRQPSAKRWGKTIINITFQFIMDCWYARNECNHAVKSDPVEKAKKTGGGNSMINQREKGKHS
jgi:hypothetical protein